MKLNLDDKVLLGGVENPLPQIEGLLNQSLDFFQSSLPSKAEMIAAWADPSIDLIKDAKLGELITKNGLRCNQIVQGLTSINTGIPSNVLKPFAKIVSNANRFAATQGWKEIAGGTMTTIDTALGAMGAIPYVSWIAKAAMTIMAAFIGQMGKPQRVLPPTLSYDKETDERSTTAAAEVLLTKDWTPLFTPVAPETSWFLRKKTHAYGVEPRDWISGAFGALPGGETGTRNIDVPLLVPHSSNPQASQHIKNLDAKMEGYDYLEKVINGYDMRPSMARIAQAAWVALTSSTTPSLFNLEPVPLITAWRDYADGIREAAGRNLSNIKQPKGEVWVNRDIAWHALCRSLELKFRGIESSHRYLDYAAHDALRLLDDRQEAALDTLQVAYCSKHQAAFRNNSLRDKLRERRGQLLLHPARWQVQPGDVVDAAYRKEIRAATSGTRPIQLRTGDKTFKGKIPKAVPMANLNLHLRPDRPPSRPPGLLTLALGGTAAYFIAKKIGWI